MPRHYASSLCLTQGSEWRLLDGDKIAALFATFLCEALSTLALQPALSLAVVQTAYANGASGSYIRSLGVPVHLAKTGVKHVHHVAVRFDVSIYFEANGHGTLLFSDAALDAICNAKADADSSGDRVKAAAATKLLAAKQLINQAIGDAISDMLLVEVILSQRGACCLLFCFVGNAAALTVRLRILAVQAGTFAIGMQCTTTFRHAKPSLLLPTAML